MKLSNQKSCLNKISVWNIAVCSHRRISVTNNDAFHTKPFPKLVSYSVFQRCDWYRRDFDETRGRCWESRSSRAAQQRFFETWVSWRMRRIYVQGVSLQLHIQRTVFTERRHVCTPRELHFNPVRRNAARTKFVKRLFQMKPTRCTLLSIFIWTFLHVSGNHVHIIRST